MLKKLNTALRLLVVGLLIYPLPLAYATEVTVNEGFEDSTYEAGITISLHTGSSAPFIYTSETNQYGTTGNSLGLYSGEHKFDFSDDISVYEVSFRASAVNNAWSIEWHFKDGTSETTNHAAQSNSNLPTMYEDIYKSYTDYNAVEGNTDKFIDYFIIDLSDLSLVDTMYWQYDDAVSTGSFATTTTTTLVSGIGDPSNLSVSANLHSGDITIDWDGATGYQYDAERYAVAFSNDNFQSMNYAVSTGNVGSETALNTEYTFTKTYLDSDFDAGDTIYFKIRADNDTDSQYSNWTAVASYTIQDVAAGVTNLTIENTEYQGLKFTWTNPGTGWSSPTSYKIEYSDGDNTWNYDDDDVYSQDITDASLTTYNLESIAAGTYWFSFYACTQNGSWCHGNQGTSPVQITVNANTPTTTIPPSLGPPMNPVVTQEYNVGVKVDWDVPNSGNQTAESYELYYRTSAEDEIKVDGITETEYTIPYGNIPNGDYTFSIRAYDSDNSIFSGYSTEPTLTVFNQKAQDDWEAAEAARKAEEARIAAEKAEQERLAELQRQRDKNLAETGYSETDAERSAREQREYEEEQARLKALEDERIRNADETGYYETNSERADREQREYEEEQARLAELERQRVSNQADTGYYETDAERSERERLEVEEAAKKAIEAATKSSTDDGEGDGEPLSKEDQDKLDKLVDTIIDLKKTLKPIEVPIEPVIEIKEIIVVVTTTTTSTTTTTIPIIEDFADEEVQDGQVETDTLDSKEGDKEIQPTDLSDEEVEVLVEAAEEAITEVVEVEELTEVFEDKAIEIIEEEELETLSKEEVEAYEEAVEEAVAEVVAELDTEEKVEVVKEVAKVSVQNLGNADTTTKAVVKAVVKEVTKVETVAELDEEEKQAVGEVLGFSEETAAQDVEIIAEAAAKEENIATAVDEYVERAIANENVEDFTLADVVTEVQIEAFISDPVGAIIDVDLENIDFATIGQDMTQDQRQKSKEVVVPVIIASQIVAQAGALISRRPF